MKDFDDMDHIPAWDHFKFLRGDDEDGEQLQDIQ